MALPGALDVTATVVVGFEPPQTPKLAASEGGEFDAESVTVPLQPFRLETVIVEGQHVYWTMVIVFGDADIWKSPQGSRLTEIVVDSETVFMAKVASVELAEIVTV